MVMDQYHLKIIGRIHSVIKKTKDAQLFYDEGAPDAWLEIFPEYLDGLKRMQAGDEIIVITWLHQGNRDVLQVHPRGNAQNPLTGVFLTRSPDRPNPIGLHRAKILAVQPHELHIDAIEAIDGTPVIDIKPVVDAQDA